MKHVSKVICYIIRGTELLVFRQPKFPEAGLQVPAGTIEPHEPPQNAALREAREETGLADVRLIKQLGLYTFDMSDWKPELHERHVFALEYSGSSPTTWKHVEEHSHDNPRQDIEFQFFWLDLRLSEPDLIADQGRFLPELRMMLGVSY